MKSYQQMLLPPNSELKKRLWALSGPIDLLTTPLKALLAKIFSHSQDQQVFWGTPEATRDVLIDATSRCVCKAPLTHKRLRVAAHTQTASFDTCEDPPHLPVKRNKALTTQPATRKLFKEDDFRVPLYTARSPRAPQQFQAKILELEESDSSFILTSEQSPWPSPPSSPVLSRKPSSPVLSRKPSEHIETPAWPQSPLHIEKPPEAPAASSPKGRVPSVDTLSSPITHETAQALGPWSTTPKLELPPSPYFGASPVQSPNLISPVTLFAPGSSNPFLNTSSAKTSEPTFLFGAVSSPPVVFAESFAPKNPFEGKTGPDVEMAERVHPFTVPAPQADPFMTSAPQPFASSTSFTLGVVPRKSRS